VGGQVTITVILLVGGGVLGKRFLELNTSQPDYSREDILVASWADGVHHPLRSVTPPDSVGRQQRWKRTYDVLERVSSIPGVTSAASGAAPLEGVFGSFPIQLTPEGNTPRDSTFRAGLNWVSPNYFQTLEIPLIHGEGLPEWDGVNDWRRYWWATDCSEAIQAYCKAVVSETFAERVWPGEDPVGKELGVYGCCWTVAGVVRDVHYKQLDQWWGTELDPNMQVYVSGQSSLLLRTGVEPLSIANQVREAVRSVDDGLVVEFTTLDDLRAESLTRPRFFFLAMGLSASIALVLAFVGLYGVIAYSVTRRSHEIGVRMALGAKRWNVRSMVLGQGMTPVIAGLILGLAGAAALVRVLESLLYGAEALDPWVMTSAVASLGLVSALACWIPARRASAVDPVRALAHD
jgi:putative ABC transport system permease protein